MKLFSVLDENFYAGVRLSETLEPDLVDLYPDGLKIDENHCPFYENGKWRDDNSEMAKEMSAKHHAPPKFFLPKLLK